MHLNLVKPVSQWEGPEINHYYIGNKRRFLAPLPIERTVVIVLQDCSQPSEWAAAPEKVVQHASQRCQTGVAVGGARNQALMYR
jgi:hypothetical protein